MLILQIPFHGIVDILREWQWRDRFLLEHTNCDMQSAYLKCTFLQPVMLIHFEILSQDVVQDLRNGSIFTNINAIIILNLTKSGS